MHAQHHFAAVGPFVVLAVILPFLFSPDLVSSYCLYSLCPVNQGGGFGRAKQSKQEVKIDATEQAINELDEPQVMNDDTDRSTLCSYAQRVEASVVV
jgi:hypothetical protein